MVDLAIWVLLALTWITHAVQFWLWSKQMRNLADQSFKLMVENADQSFKLMVENAVMRLALAEMEYMVEWHEGAFLVRPLQGGGE